MDLKALQGHWDDFARTDPLWAVLTEPDKRRNRWDAGEFFARGVSEVRSVMEYVKSLGMPLKTQRVLDFGCGVGRLTQALAEYFGECYGVDISPTMVELAGKYNRHGARCRYLVNDSDDLRVFQDGFFDFIYSVLTLQHMEPRYSLNYIREFARTLRPGGILIFQLPSERLPATLSSRMRELAKALAPAFMMRFYRKMKYGSSSTMEVYYVSREAVVALLEENNCRVIDVVEDREAGPLHRSFRYCAVKSAI
jgi:ubiquinone/menaquinone biosynthesis C-methylase UbiE